MTTIKQGQQTEKTKKAAPKPPAPKTKGGAKPAKGGPAPKPADSRTAAPGQAFMPRRIDFGSLQMPAMARDNTRVAFPPPRFADNKARSLPFALPGSNQIRSLPAPRQMYFRQAPPQAPGKPKAPAKPQGYHTKSETYQHKLHYGVMLGEGIEWAAHKGGGHLGHKVASKMAPGLKVLGPVAGAWQIINAFGTMMDPFASHHKASTQLTSGLIQVLSLGLLGGAAATGIEMMGPSEREECMTRRAARAKAGVDFDGGYPQAACEYWVKELAKCGASAHDVRQIVDQWAETNDEYKQHMGIGRLYRNRPNDQEREAIVKAYLHHLKEGH